MIIKKLARKLPFISWRDTKLRELRDQNRRLRQQTGDPQGRIPERWSAPAEDEVCQLVKLSGLFDSTWYLDQLEREPVSSDSLLDFLRAGEAEGLSPHPAFMPAFYLECAKSRKLDVLSPIAQVPLQHYITTGAASGLSSHPAFDAEEYLTRHPDSRDVPGGPLSHFLNSSDGGVDSKGRHREAFMGAAVSAERTIRATRGYGHLERDVSNFDTAAEADVKEELRRSQLPEPLPMVSIVIPTKDRVALLGATLDSVLAQTYSSWELIVVDDGSTDSTPDLLAGYDDPRLRVLNHPESRGVAAARNTGLHAATGTYVAYLDSDNTWFPDFLELMVRFLVRDGHRAAYAMSALVEEGGAGRSLYRGMSFNREALRERNYIDCIVLVHERSLLDEVGMFDETLRRNVDWDLFIRLADVCDFGFVPFIATQYDVWETRNDRITTDEPMGYRFVVRQRALIDWSAQRDAVAERVEDLLSVVIVVTNDVPTAIESVERVLATATMPVEIVLVESRLSDTQSVRLQCVIHEMQAVRFHRLTTALPLEVARNVGAALSTGSTLAFLLESSWCETNWDAPLKTALANHSVVQPVTLTDGGAVWSAGVEFQDDGRSVMVYQGFAGDAPEVRTVREREGVTAACMAVSATDFLEAEGFDPLFSNHFSGSELSVRISATTGRRPASVGESQVSLRVAPPTPTSATALRRARQNDVQLREVRGQAPSRLPLTLTQDGYGMAGFLRLQNTQVEPTPLLIHQRPERPLRWSLKIGPPSVARRTNWGDWHFALALQDSLERCGHEVTIDCKDEWYRSSAYLDDVVLVLRGVSVYEVNPAHTNISWVISHPERVTAAEMADYDLVFGASARWCGRIRPKLHRPVETLLQCTDQRRFHPVEPDPRRAHRVLTVANARGIRPSVAAALDASIVPSIYGLRWQGLVPEGSWQGPYVPNDELAAVYTAAGVVLNDHWDDMREEGLLSNRLFDLVASDARVISDDLPEIHEVFDDVVLTYTTSADMPALVHQHLNESPERQEARQAMGRNVREHHTFDARARTLSERVYQFRAEAAAREI